MLIILTVLACLLAPTQLQAEPSTVEASSFLPGQLNVLDGSGRRVAVIRPNPWLDQQDVYGQPGEERALTIQPSPFLPQLNVYDLIGSDHAD